MQRLTWGPLTAKVSGGLWLDGGHNPSAGEAIATILSSWQEPVDMVCGMMANKDVEGYLRPLRPWIKRLCVVPVPVDPHQGIGGGRDPESLKIAAQSVGIANVTVAPSVSDAVEAFADRSTRRILIAGSLYLAGAVLAENG
jgi:dihydrofolate synthase/folylpolyglutamate synthase